MDRARIAQLLEPFLVGPASAASPDRGDAGLLATRTSAKLAVLSETQLEHISMYIDLLVLWNARINLTAVREPEEIVTRHFGESLFAACHLFPAKGEKTGDHLIDVGSGAGFPGLPIKIWAPEVRLTLIESNHKKATFLREAIRKLTFTNADVFSGRAEDYGKAAADVVTLRAVERFDAAVSVASRLVAERGRLALLIGAAQVRRAHELAPDLRWAEPISIPLSSHRVLLVATQDRNHERVNHE